MSHYKTLSKPLISNHFLVSIFILIELHFCNLRKWITLYPISTVKQTRWIDKVQNYSATTYRINKSSSTVFSYAWNKDHYQDKDQASSYAALQDIMHPPVRQETGIYEHKLSANKNIYNENRDFAIAKSQFSPNPMLKKGLTHYKEWISDHLFTDLLSLVWSLE